MGASISGAPFRRLTKLTADKHDNNPSQAVRTSLPFDIQIALFGISRRIQQSEHSQAFKLVCRICRHHKYIYISAQYAAR
jgi:hypothetical protein